MKFLLLSLFLGELFLISSGEGVTYCVKPTPTGSCLDHDCRQCETLQYYFDNVNETINQQNNVTLLLMSRSHTVYVNNTVTVSTPVVSLLVVNSDVSVTVMCSFYDYWGYWHCHFHIQFTGSVGVSSENLSLTRYNLDVAAVNLVLIGCSFGGQQPYLDRSNECNTGKLYISRPQ